MAKIIDSVQDLMKLSREELDEVLLSEKYNKSNLRELVRNSLKVANEYKSAFEYELSLNENKDDNEN